MESALWAAAARQRHGSFLKWERRLRTPARSPIASFEIATKKGWAAEALVYNELAQKWPKLEELASGAGARVKPIGQGELQL